MTVLQALPRATDATATVSVSPPPASPLAEPCRPPGAPNANVCPGVPHLGRHATAAENVRHELACPGTSRDRKPLRRRERRRVVAHGTPEGHPLSGSEAVRSWEENIRGASEAIRKPAEGPRPLVRRRARPAPTAARRLLRSSPARTHVPGRTDSVRSTLPGARGSTGEGVTGDRGRARPRRPGSTSEQRRHSTVKDRRLSSPGPTPRGGRAARVERSDRGPGGGIPACRPQCTGAARGRRDSDEHNGFPIENPGRGSVHRS